MKVVRFGENPIVVPDMDGRMGRNINGPSLIRVPDWVERPLGRYYLYFAHHQGSYIRMAWAESVAGPWTTHEPGVLDLSDSHFTGHVASPDVHVDDARRQIRMYYHGSGGPGTEDGQKSRVGLSGDGLGFRALPEILGTYYFRVWGWDGWHYALARHGHLFRSHDGLTDFQRGKDLFGRNLRHNAVAVDGHTLQVCYSDIGDCPERILLARIDMRPDWTEWTESEPVVVLEPETAYEGADLPLEPSKSGWAPERVRQLRDPAIFTEDGRTYLLYSVAGEHGIAIAEIVK